ncbi:hypothetical protein [Pseudorhodoplanes sp.]|uniref:hypothetical protein n=1 Tax=Pseudorhodoplanes sp. TaxID=1934341 RepID=UPI002D7F7310|nr:hypothetical protein [Pseudorhodoplanes sp.]
MMLRTALLLFGLVLCGPVQAADPTFPNGSHIGLVPPPGMTASTSFPGFEDRDRKAAILLAQVPGPVYEQFLKAMSAGAINIPGVSNAKRELMLTDGGAAHLVVGDQEAEGVKFRKWLMITRRNITDRNADTAFSFIVTVQIPEEASDVYSEDVVRKTLGTVALRAVIPPQEILDKLPFRLTERANFEGVRLLVPGRAVMLTERAGTGDLPSTDAVAMISVGAGAPSQADERANFAQNVLRSIQGFNNLRILSQEPMRIGGQPGYEIRLEGQSAGDNTDVVIVQWMRFGVGGFIRMVGISPKTSWPENFTRFRQVRDGINARE